MSFPNFLWFLLLDLFPLMFLCLHIFQFFIFLLEIQDQRPLREYDQRTLAEVQLEQQLNGVCMSTNLRRSISEPVTIMETPFSLPSSSANSRDILKNQLKEQAIFKMTPNQIYKTKISQKVSQYMFIFACRLYGQESTKTFLQSWEIILEQLVREENHVPGLACWLIMSRNR